MLLIFIIGKQHLGQKESDIQLKLKIGHYVLISLCASYILALVEIFLACDVHLCLNNLES